MQKNFSKAIEKMLQAYLKYNQEYIKALYSKPKRSPKGKRKGFSNYTKQQILNYQNNRCNECFSYLEYADFDHIDGDRTNNSVYNCQALCPNCHARKSRNR